MALPSKMVVTMAVLLIGLSVMSGGRMLEAANWCVARSGATEQALQTALDYACGAGADCAPIQPSGLCYLPNTLQAHASFAFNSYYQRRGMAPGSCDFSGAAAVAGTDPSYGSCVYPSSLSTAGGTTTPTLNAPPLPGTTTPIYGTGGLTPDFDSNDSRASLGLATTVLIIHVCSFLALPFIIQPM